VGSFLRRCVEENTGATAELMLAQILEQREGVEAAQNYVTRQLERHPTMRVFHKLMDYHSMKPKRAREGEPGRAAQHGGRAGAQQTALPLPEMRLYRSYAVLALSVLPLVVNH
jgi:lipopolysaccharide biosynthesis regulator YciM